MTIPAGTPAGTVFRLDVSEYLWACAGKTASFSFSRRFRYGAYTGFSSAAYNIPADDLSGGASASFYSLNAPVASQRPYIQLFYCASVGTGVLNLAAPPTPAGRRSLLQAGSNSSLAAMSASISGLLSSPTLSVPAVVQVASYSLYFEVAVSGPGIVGLIAANANDLHKQLLIGLAGCLGEPTESNMLLQSSVPTGTDSVNMGILADGYTSPPDLGFSAATRDLARMMSSSGASFFGPFIAAVAAASGGKLSVTAAANPATAAVQAVYQARGFGVNPPHAHPRPGSASSPPLGLRPDVRGPPPPPRRWA